MALLRDERRLSTAARYVHAVTEMHRWTRRVVSWWLDDGFDLLLTPTLAEPPPVLGDVGRQDDGGSTRPARSIPFAAYTAPFNVTGQPAMSVPLSLERRRARRSASSSSPRRSAKTCCSAWPPSSSRHGPGPTAARPCTPELAERRFR